MAANPYTVGLDQNPANYVPLSPLSFLERSAFVYPKRIAVIQGSRQYTWKESYDRCRQLASSLQGRGIGKGDTVAAMLPNSAPMFECHFGVAMTGAVVNTLNTRLDAEAIAFMLTHGEAKVLITDREFSGHHRGGAGPARRPQAAGHRCAGPRLHRRRSARRKGLRSLSHRRRSGFRLATAGQRVGCHRPELHLGHHRQPEGRRLPPSRCLPELGLQYHLVGHAAARRVSVDAADVPLQRLVFPVDAGGQRRDQRLPAQGRSGADLRPDQGAPGQPPVRRADRLRHADQRPGGAQGRHRAHGQRPDRRCRTAGRDHRGLPSRWASISLTSTA